MIGLVTSSNQSSNSNENASINQNGIKKDWRETIAAAFNSWKICLDSCLISSNAPAHQLLTASISIYALAHIVLSIDVHELQIYAGAEKTLGLTVANQVVESTKLKVKRWADSKEGRASTWHAAHFLRSSLIDLDQVSEMLHSLHYTWACYISVLTVVAYGTALDETEREMAIRNGYKDLPFKRNRDRKRRSSHHHDPKQNSLEIAMRYLDTICTSCPENLKDLEVVVDHQIDSIGLIEMIYQVIKSSRWEIALEGAKILDGLIVSKSKDLG